MSTTGDLIADRYRLVTQLGSGAMGVVWEARDERLQRRVALKQLRPQLGLDADERALASQRAMREARISARLHHPYAVTVFDVVEHEGQPCLILQYVSSMPLSTVLREGGPLEESEAAQVGAQVASALAAAHAVEVVHRDIKPGNILIADDGTALLSDFGISRARGDASLTMTGMVHGTPAFLAPEVARGADASPASDVFSLGATLYAALEGHPPFGSDPSAIAVLHRAAEGVIDPPQRSGALAPVLLAMLSADAAARPTMAEVAERLERLRPKKEPATRSDHPTVIAPTQVLPPAALAGSAAAAPSGAAPAPSGAPSPTLGSAPAPVVDPAGADDPPETSSGRRRTLAVALALVALVAITALAVGLLPRGGSDPDRAVLAPTTAAVSASATPSEPESPSASESEPEPSPSESAEPEPSASEAEPSSTAPAEPDPTAESSEPEPEPTPTEGTDDTPTKGKLSRAIRNYYALMPEDTDAGWRLLTPAYRASHGGSRSAYEQFWGEIDRVRASDITATRPDRVQATITYSFADGRTSRERTTFRLVDDDGVLKIDDSTVG